MSRKYIIVEIDIHHNNPVSEATLSGLHHHISDQCKGRTNQMAEYHEWFCTKYTERIYSHLTSETFINIESALSVVCRQFPHTEQFKNHVTTCAYISNSFHIQSESLTQMLLIQNDNTILLPISECSRKHISYKTMCYVLINLQENSHKINNNKQNIPEPLPEHLIAILSNHAVCLNNNARIKSVVLNKEPCDIIMKLLAFSPNAINTKCRNGQFQCLDNHCISGNLLLDGESDCPDKSDETHNPEACMESNILKTFQSCNKCQLPTCKCLPKYFQCRSGGCLSWNKVCDKINNCDHGSDEAECHYKVNSIKPVRLFSCYHSNRTIPDGLVADLIADCPHMEDENPIYDMPMI